MVSGLNASFAIVKMFANGENATGKRNVLPDENTELKTLNRKTIVPQLGQKTIQKENVR